MTAIRGKYFENEKSTFLNQGNTTWYSEDPLASSLDSQAYSPVLNRGSVLIHAVQDPPPKPVTQLVDPQTMMFILKVFTKELKKKLSTTPSPPPPTYLIAPWVGDEPIVIVHREGTQT